MKASLPLLLFIIISSSLKAQTSFEPVTPAYIRLTDSVACTPVKDQSQSPTCWVFGTNSLFESDMLKRSGITLNLSEMFIARYAYIDKIKKWLSTKGKTYCEGGGQFHDVIRVIHNYGMVPEEVYTGRPGGEYSHNHAKLDTSIKRFIHQLLDQGKTGLSPQDLKHINDTLDHYLGKVPATFLYQSKLYTPKTFASEVIHFVEEYIEVTAFADKPLNKKFILEDKYNWANDSFYNVSLADFEMLVDTALDKGWSVGWEGDVTEKYLFNYFSGFASLNDWQHNYDEERVTDYKNESTQRDHMLHIVGVGRDENNHKWYYMKNSWGNFSRYKGYMYMREDYFKLKTVILMVNKAALPQSIREKLGVK